MRIIPEEMRLRLVALLIRSEQPSRRITPLTRFSPHDLGYRTPCKLVKAVWDVTFEQYAGTRDGGDIYFRTPVHRIFILAVVLPTIRSLIHRVTITFHEHLHTLRHGAPILPAYPPQPPSPNPPLPTPDKRDNPPIPHPNLRHPLRRPRLRLACPDLLRHPVPPPRPPSPPALAKSREDNVEHRARHLIVVHFGQTLGRHLSANKRLTATDDIGGNAARPRDHSGCGAGASLGGEAGGME
jgi:hypothetical protein